jgi:S1-C subfamily serine protease
MKSINKCRKAGIVLIALANRLGLFIARQRTLRMPVLLTVLALIPAASAFAAAKCNQLTADLFESKSPAVVLITALTINPYRMDDRVHQATGSGFIIDTEGLVMTNSHVVFGAQALAVTLDDGTELPARLLGADPIFDIAILQIPKPDRGKLPVLVFGDSDSLRPGDKVIAIGNPLGLDQTITSGIVSGLNRILPERPRLLAHPMIQTDAAINPGNSGGPLLNRCGDVIGVTSEILGDAQNIGFAIPSNLARSAVGSLVEKGRLSRPWLGVDGSMIDAGLRKILTLPLTDGFLVEAVERDSPAGVAGIVGGRLPVKVGTRSLILGGDVIVAINDIELKNVESLQRALDTIRIGTQARLKVFRQGKIFTTEFAIIERPLQPGDVPESSQSFTSQQEPGKNNNKIH